MEEEVMLYTFTQPVRDGYYYIVVKASSAEEAASITADVAGSFEHLTGNLRFLNQYAEGELVLEPKMQARLDEIGYAHRLVSVRPRPHHERTRHYGILPK